MSTNYALFCISCLRHVEIYDLNGVSPMPRETDVDHQQLINFMHDHRGCTLKVIDDSNDLLNDSRRNDTRYYPRFPYPSTHL